LKRTTWVEYNQPMKKGHIKNEERLEIYLLLKKSYSHRQIGDALGRSHTTISREIRRNSIKDTYDPHRAKQKARNRRKCSKYQGMKVRDKPELRGYIINRLEVGWTPEKIAGRLKEVDTRQSYISHMGIYKWLYSAFGQAYCPYLLKRRHRKKKRRQKKTRREMISGRVGIEYRSIAANQRMEYGHFEGDTVVSGKKYGSVSLVVLVDRKSRYVRIRKLMNLKPKTNCLMLEEMASDIYKKTLTLDNGIENKNHEALAQSLGIDIYFCDPYSSWQKGAVENVNGIIRRFIPKGSNINDYTEKQIQIIEDYLNHTPKKCLNYMTPYEIMIENNLFLN
jgi:IS30 family transposase